MGANQGFVKVAIGTALVLLLAGAAAYKGAQNEERRSRFRQRDQEVHAAVALGREIQERVTSGKEDVAVRRGSDRGQRRETLSGCLRTGGRYT